MSGHSGFKIHSLGYTTRKLCPSHDTGQCSYALSASARFGKYTRLAIVADLRTQALKLCV